MNQKLGNDQILESSDLLRFPDSRTDSIGQVFPESGFQREGKGRATQGKNVDRVILFRESDNRQSGMKGADSEEDVGIDRILRVGEEKPS